MIARFVATMLQFEGVVPSDALDSLLRLISEHLPTSGVIEVVYEVREPGAFGKIVSGYDLQSGAFYRINGGRITAGDGRGRFWTGSEGQAGFGASTRTDTHRSWRTVETTIPIAWLDWIRDDPKRVRSVVPEDGGGFKAEILLPSREAEVVYAIRIDDRARLVSWKELSEDAGPVVMLEYTESNLPTLARHRNFELASFVFHEHPDPKLFTPERLEKLWIESKTKFVPERLQITSDTPIPTSVPTGMRGVVRDEGLAARYRVPLIATGLAAMAVAGWAWWRRRA